MKNNVLNTSRTLTITATLLAASLLTACGGTSNSGGGGALSSTSINSYQLTGSEQVNTNEVIPINAGINEGAFQVQWNVSSSNPYHVRLFVSEDALLTDDDKRFFSQNCGTPSAIYNCGASANFNCQFDTSNVLSCGDRSSFNRGTNIGTMLSQLPQNMYLIMEACNGLFDSCKEDAITVQFQ